MGTGNHLATFHNEIPGLDSYFECALAKAMSHLDELRVQITALHSYFECGLIILWELAISHMEALRSKIRSHFDVSWAQALWMHYATLYGPCVLGMAELRPFD